MKKGRKGVQRIDVTLEELRKVRERIDQRQPAPEDWPILGALVSKLIASGEANQERMRTKITAAAAAVAAEGESEPVRTIDAEFTDHTDAANSGPDSVDPTPSGESGPGVSTSKPDASKPDTASKSDAEKKKKKGHGRNGAAAYANATHISHALLGVIGVLCEVCRIGSMSPYREKVVIRIVGQPLFAAVIHHFQQARCRICNRIVRATVPASVLEGLGTSYITYDWSACAMLIVMHYFGGAPFKRLESLHEGWGVPLADANQWNLVDASDDLLRPLHKRIELSGIQNATTLRIDDTGSAIIETMHQIQSEIDALELLGKSTKDVRTGINATGVYLETPEGTIILFYTGRHHAGEILDQLLKHRRSSELLSKVTDGAAKNFSHEHQDKLSEGTCNAHAFLKFRAVKDKYPAEYAVAGEVYKKVFDYDDAAKALSLTPYERMLFHRHHSKPQMERLKAMCETKIDGKLVEPNSLLWEPVTFIINQWERLIKFCEVPGMPLDTNLVEQTLIIPVRYLAGSFNYQTETGAEVGDRLMSIVATARANGVEPVAYLTECLRNHEDLAKRPEYYLPWVVRERLKDQLKPPKVPKSPPAGQSAAGAAAASS